MLSLDDIRSKVTRDQIFCLDDIWRFYRGHKKWIPESILRKDLRKSGRSKDLEKMVQLGGSIVFENHSEGEIRYFLTALGILLTHKGKEIEKNYIKMLKLLQEMHNSDSDIKVLTSEWLGKSLNLSDESLFELFGLVGSPMFPYDQPVKVGSSDGQQKFEFQINSSSTEDLFEEDVENYVQRTFANLYDQGMPVENGKRAFYLSRGSIVPKKTTRQVNKPSKKIFIIHGHDNPNLVLLRDLCVKRWRLKPIILYSEAGRGKTIIEKFEREAKDAVFAFALFTPDDRVLGPRKRKYHQPRPNVHFELGWFYGKLGRDKVCIIFKHGTELHSDLQGISRIEFKDKVTEKTDQILKELKALKVVD